jgi:hypothetical protein
MAMSCWRLVGDMAHLQLDRLRAEVHLLRPRDGLGEARWEDARQPLGVLGVQFPAWTPGDPQMLLEAVCRGNELVATYRESAAWPVRVDVAWRAVSPEGLAITPVAVVEVVVSVRTELLDSRPGLAVRSMIGSDDVLRLRGAASGAWEPLDRDGLPAAVRRPDDAGCLVARFPGSDVSYVEMVHPADFQETQIRRVATDEAIIEALHPLFVERLEKGVILRARVRGAWVPRSNDLQAAAVLYAAFAAADPPL